MFSRSKNDLRKVAFSFGTLALMSLSSASVQAQSRYDDSYGGDRNYREPIVSIYEDCDFRGDRRDISVGDFRSMRELDFGNDSLSSIRVPRELEVILYEHDDFDGDYARVDRDISCFDYDWNDEVSSLRVVYADDRRSRNDRYDRPRYEERSRNEDWRQNNRSDRGRVNFNDGVTAKNVSQVTFDNRVLQQVSKTEWKVINEYRDSTIYRETGRDRENVYLQNRYSGEQIRIDLSFNDVTVIGSGNRKQRYEITSRKAVAFTQPDKPRAQPQRAPNRRISGQCFTYKAYTTGGDAGVRFVGKDGFYRFNRKAKTGRICHDGSLVMEMNKTAPGTRVIIEINGSRFVFEAGESGELRNNWYRKSVTLLVNR